MSWAVVGPSELSWMNQVVPPSRTPEAGPTPTSQLVNMSYRVEVIDSRKLGCGGS